MTLIQLFTAIANAIRAKTGSSEQILAENFPTEIADITTGNLSDEEYQEADNDLNEILEGTEVTKIFPPDWSQIGYEDTPQSVIDDFNYSKNIKDTWDSSVTNLNSKFAGNTNLKFMPLVDTSNVTNMSRMFSSCNNLTSMVKINTSKVTNISYMFNYCVSLTSLDLSSFDTSKVTNMEYMFNGCTGLTSLDVSNFDTNNVTNMGYMFGNCRSLSSINFGDNFTLKKCQYSSTLENMFLCPKLSNETLNDILRILPTATSYTAKTLKFVGLSQTQAETCQTLSNYNDFIAAGWRTGY